MTDNVWPQGPDGLFDLQKVLARDNVSDYVERGVGFTPTWSADETDISAGFAVISDGSGRAFVVEPNARTDVPLPSSTGVNYVYLAFDPDVDNAISYHVDTDDTPPADPSLKVAELDASTNTVTRVKRDPAATYDGATFTGDVDAGGNAIRNAGSVTTEDIRATRSNESVAARLDREYVGAAVADDGTHYALYDDGTDLLLYSGSDPYGSGLSQQYTFSGEGGISRTIGMHVTANGTILVGVGGSVMRSTDGGSSFSAGASLATTGTHVWSFSENSAGSIIIGERGQIRLLESTDDGQTATELVGGTTLNFVDHIHKAAYHPQDGDILLTGGDSNQLFYIYDSSAATWYEFNCLMGQYVAVEPHPTEAGTWLVGHDEGVAGENFQQRGIVKVDYDGAGGVTQTFVQQLNVTQSVTSGAMGSFSIRAVYSPTDGTGYFLASSFQEGTDESLWASQTLNGRVWGQVASLGTYMTSMTQSQAPWEHIDSDAHDAVVGADAAANLQTATDRVYGQSPGGQYVQQLSDTGVILNDIRNIPGNDDMRVYLQNNTLSIRNTTTGADIFKFRIDNEDVVAQGGGIVPAPWQMRKGFGDDLSTDLSTVEGNYVGELRRHDGADGNPAGYYKYNGTSWEGPLLSDEANQVAI